MLFLCNPFITSGQALIAGTGTFTVLGREALFNTSILQVSGAGSFALSGQPADFRRNLIFEAAAGAIALDGQIVTMIYGKGLLAEVGAFTVTGNEAAVLRALLLEAGTGSFTVTGEDADFVRHLALAAEPGLFSLSGQTADFRAGVNLGAEAGLFALTGQEASIARGAVLQASAGAYALNGQGVTLRRALRLQASMGSFALTGQDADLNFDPGIVQATATYISSASATNDSSSYSMTFSTALGPGKVIIVLQYRNASGEAVRTISDATLGTDDCSVAVEIDDTKGTTSAILTVELGGSAQSGLEVNLSGSASRIHAAGYNTANLSSLTPTDTGGAFAWPSSVSSRSDTLSVSAGGIIIAGTFHNNSSTTWSNLTEDIDATVESGFLASTAHGEFGTAQSVTVTATKASSGNYQTLSIASFR